LLAGRLSPVYTAHLSFLCIDTHYSLQLAELSLNYLSHSTMSPTYSTTGQTQSLQSPRGKRACAYNVKMKVLFHLVNYFFMIFDMIRIHLLSEHRRSNMS
jgi:hypothetical protein